jgi:hypothetical protein
MSKNFISCYERLVLFKLLIFDRRIVHFALFLILFANAILLRNFKSTSEASAVFLLKHSLVKMCLVLHRACFLGKTNLGHFLLRV